MRNLLNRVGHFLLRIAATIASGAVSFVVILLIGALTQITIYGLLAAILFLIALFGIPLAVARSVFVQFPPFVPKPSFITQSNQSTFSRTSMPPAEYWDAHSTNDVVIASMDDWEAFLDTHVPIRHIRTKVAGVSFCNDDGSSRQEILSHCRAGDMIDLELYLYEGEPAFKVHSKYGQIGNLPKEDALLIDSIYYEYVTAGEITKITGGTNGHFYGCNLLLTVYQKK